MEQPEPSDDALVAAALDGDERAFETLLDRHDQVVLRVLRLLGVPSADREDLAQEVFVKVFRHLGSFHRGRKFSNWIYRISVNVARDYRASDLKNPAQPELENPNPDATEGSSPGPEDRLKSRDLADRLESAVAELSDRERAVFVLHEMEELSTHEVARALGITQITVRRHLSRARASLRSLLEDES